MFSKMQVDSSLCTKTVLNIVHCPKKVADLADNRNGRECKLQNTQMYVWSEKFDIEKKFEK